MLKKEFWTCWKKEGDSRVVKELHESSIFLSVMTRQGFTSRQQFEDAKCHNFLDLGSFLVLGITSSTDVQIEWFKFLWKYNQITTTFMKKFSWEKVFWMDKNTLEPTAYAWMVTLGDWMVPFRVFDIIQAFPAFF